MAAVEPAQLERTKLFIGGQWVDPADGSVVTVIEAATEETLGTVASAGASDVDTAASAAAAALAGQWGRMTPGERAEIMDRLAGCLSERGEEIARLVSRENGMPISLSRSSNGFAPAAIVRYYASIAREWEVEELRHGARGQTTVRREPVGIVAAITPWNYPQALAAMKFAPALAAGCTVILKPAPETTLDALSLGDAALEAGVPDGVLNIVPGDADVGRYLVSHSRVDKVAFTGSTAAGRVIAEVCGRLLRPATLELGGKSAAIVLEDADLDMFATALPGVSFANNGQTCHASTRILAPRSRYEEVVDAVTARASQLVIGDPLDKATEIGPLVSDQQRLRVLRYIESARSSCAGRITTGGGRPTELSRGWYVQPTVFADVDNSAEIAQEEVFGPVVVVIPYRDTDEAVKMANDSSYGLAGTVWTQNRERGMEIARQIRSGSFGINHYSLHLEAPFGGVKGSGLGRELGPEGVMPYVELKSIYEAKQ
jgi:aldehyde dehydrogenase (NAD+)